MVGIPEGGVHGERPSGWLSLTQSMDDALADTSTDLTADPRQPLVRSEQSL
jgi:hypothetical protein